MLHSTSLQQNTTDDYLFPFLWLRGESDEQLIEEMHRIYDCGIRQVCLESRPHPDFMGPGWWHDLDLLISTAKELGMKLWILDDDRFPTGHCNGWIRNRYPERARLFLKETHADVLGLGYEAALRISMPEDGRIIGVIACAKPSWDDQALTACDARVLTDQYDEEKGILYFTLPRGRWRIFTLFTTHNGGSRSDYMNLIDAQSVHTLIEAVYELHYARYGHEFGKTILGFFSDEPELGNMPGYEMDAGLGRPGILLPWSEALAERLKGAWKEAWLIHLLACWYEVDDLAPQSRWRMMKEITDLVHRCFSGQVGDWCRRHSVSYIGHIIEDSGAHTRTGCSIGHYFAEMRGQDMAGVDVVHFQILPGFDDPIHRWIDWEDDGSFFHYGLAKLASSEARLDEKKQGRALCEIFGNYGWAEGVGLMQWLAQHMLVRGVNRFVPHAFSPADFPDPECPPHFYARGNNPQYRYFQKLCMQMQRVCGLLEGGEPVIDAAVLYHAESEWCDAAAMPFHAVMKELLTRQVDCDVIPAMDLARVQWQDGAFHIGNATYRMLILPACHYLPVEAAIFARQAAEHGVRVIQVNALPQKSCSAEPLPVAWDSAVQVVSLHELAAAVQRKATAVCRILTENRALRMRAVRQGRKLVVLLVNESPYDEVVTDILFENTRQMTVYDAWHDQEESYAGNRYPLRLLPGELQIFILSSEEAEGACVRSLKSEHALSVAWRVRTPDGEQLQLSGYPNLTGRNCASVQAGTFTYEGTFAWSGEETGQAKLRLTDVNDCADVYLNGVFLGNVITNGRLNVQSALVPGDNILRIDVTNTLFWTTNDNVSSNMAVPQTGLAAAPVLEIY